MGKLEELTWQSGTMHPELEKGELRAALRRKDSVLEMAQKVSYYKAMISFALLVILIWYHGWISCAWPSSSTRRVQGVPYFVTEFAPLVWLDVHEKYFPSDIYAQVANTHPEVNYTTIANPPSPLTLHNLDALNDYGNDGMDVYLTSTSDVTTAPRWLDGVVPDSSGKTNGAISCATIINDHGAGFVDVFYMYFYAYNLGNTVLFQELGDHIGDWEHNMIRFHHGVPKEIWYSQHAYGEAFTYETVEKEGVRPISYSAMGSHANYAIAGTHDHTIPDLNLPAGFLQDYTSQGLLWDPIKNTYFYSYDAKTMSFSAADGDSPLGAMHFKGQWGDEQYKRHDPRQKLFFGFYKYVDGPTGPWDKQLNRTRVCPENGILCIVRDSLGP